MAGFILEHTWQFIALGLLLLGSAFFSGGETSLFSLTNHQLHQFRNSRHRILRIAAELRSVPDDTLITLLAGNMVINVLFFAISSAMLIELSHKAKFLTIALSLLPLLMIVFFGEVIPKAAALAQPTLYATLVALPVFLLQKAIRPVRWVLAKMLVNPLVRLLAPPQKTDAPFVTTDELKLLLARSAEQGAIAHDESALLQEVVELRELKVKDVMVPRVEMVAMSMDAETDELIELLKRTRLRKVPVYLGRIDQIEGLVYAKEAMLAPDKSLRELMRPIQFVPELQTLDALLQHFRTQATQIAIAVDEYGGVAGLVTLEDVLEEIVGEIYEPRDVKRAAPLVEVSGDEYLVDGRLGLKQWQTDFSQSLGTLSLSTIGGFVTSLLGRVPRVGDTAIFGNLEFKVESVRRRRIERIRIKRLNQQ